MKNSMALLSLGALLVAGCGTDPATAQKVADLEAKIDALEKQVAAGGGMRAGAPGAPGAPAAPPANSEEEQAAAAILKEANGHFEAMEYDKAKVQIAELEEKYPATRAARAAKRIKDELDVIGKDAGSLEVEKWFQGNASLADGEATLLVFWEVWCPHCKREVPKIEATYQKYKGQGFQIVGLTKMTRNITEDQVNEFLKENNVSYPIAKEAGMNMSNLYGVKGIPAAAVVKDGKIVWRGHPARVTDEMIEGWIN
ncbi:MAG: TlpA family protein disulfide reductase [Alphaproteobacteria bacterium]|nr:TlpA family protein disulfide reductase [Alphaproteobacteria bacterium]